MALSQAAVIKLILKHIGGSKIKGSTSTTIDGKPAMIKNSSLAELASKIGQYGSSIEEVRNAIFQNPKSAKIAEARQNLTVTLERLQDNPSVEPSLVTQVQDSIDALDAKLERYLQHTNILSGITVVDEIAAESQEFLDEIEAFSYAAEQAAILANSAIQATEDAVDLAQLYANNALTSSNDAAAFSASAANSAVTAEGAASTAEAAEGVATAAALDANNFASAASVSASSAESFANSAGQSATAAEASSVTAQASADDAANSATASATSASAAAASANSAGQSASAASTSELNANTSAASASVSASSAAGSATDADGFATAAATSATNSQTSAVNANTSAGAAAASATAADGSATQANTSAASAASSATLSAGYSTDAANSAQDTLPSTFERDGLYFGGDNGSATPQNIVWVDSPSGRAGQVDDDTTYAGVATKGRLPCESGDVFRVRALVSHVSGTERPVTLRIEEWPSLTGGTRTIFGSFTSATITSTSPVWVETTFIVANNGFVTADALLNFPSPYTATQNIHALEIENINSEYNASVSANAALSSSQAAAANATSAATSATNAQTSAVNANTSAGQAAANATSAATSATNANTSAASAASSENLAALYSSIAAPARSEVSTNTHGTAAAGAPAAIPDVTVETGVEGEFVRLDVDQEGAYERRVIPVSADDEVRLIYEAEALGGGANPTLVPTFRWLDADYNLVDTTFDSNQSLTLDPQTFISGPFTRPANNSIVYCRAGVKVDHNGGRDAGVYRLWGEDVSESQRAEAQATIATAQAVAANSSAASAEASSALAAKLGRNTLNPNPIFSAYSAATNTTTTAPDEWENWVTSPAARGKVASSLDTGEGSPFVHRDNTEPSTNAGIRQYLFGHQPGWYVIEATVKTVTAFIQGAGLLLQTFDSTNTTNIGTNEAINFATYPTNDGVVQGTNPGSDITLRYSKLVHVDLPNDNVTFRLFAMTGWTGFGAVSGKTLDWQRASIRPASAAEIQAGESIPTLEASVTVNQSAIATLEGAAAHYETVVAASGSNNAIVRLTAGAGGSDVDIAADRISLYTGSGAVPALYLDANGNATFSGELNVGTGSGARVNITQNLIQVYDANNTLRVRLGVWT